MGEAAARFLLGNYEPLLQLATGGMATVYVARQVGAAGFERLVVVKRVHAHLLADREFSDMFRDEARLSAMLHHPNVVPVTDVVEDAGELFLVMAYVESSALSSLMKAAAEMQQRLPPATVVRVLVDTLSGLHAAHEARDMRGNHLEIVHRDVSPQNIVVGTDGISRLIDFGVAKASHRITETKSGSLKGKYGYMSPEQVRGQVVDRRSDLFGAGIVLWEALLGRRLFRGETDLECIRLVAEGDVPPPSSLLPSLPPSLDAVVLRALARDPDARFQTATEFVEALESALPPAPARDVASVVRAYCGERIEERRGTLEGLLAGRVEPLSMSRLSTGPRDEGTIEASPAARRRKPMALPANDEGGTESQIAATHDAPAPRRGGRARLAVFGGAAVVAAALTLVVFAFRRAPPGASVGTTPSTTTSASGPELASDEVALEVSAPAPIESVRALGMRSVRVKDDHARLVVVRWTGELTVDGVLLGGTAVRATANADGPRTLALVPVDTSPTLSASAPALRPTPPRPPLPAKPAATTVPPSELHENPYGP